jgi:GNAT superfamily N-acetyltransferase
MTTKQHDNPACEYVLRPAGLADKEAIFSLLEALHNYNASLDPLFALADGWREVMDGYLRHAEETGEGYTVLAWKGDKPVGMIVMFERLDARLFKYRRWVELVDLYVVPEARGTGLGARLLEAGIAWARARGADRIQLYVTATNLGAKRFYAKHGFIRTQEIWRLKLEDVPGDSSQAES